MMQGPQRLSVAVVAGLLLLAFAGEAMGQRRGQRRGPRSAQEDEGGAPEKNKIKPYDEVITDAAATSTGLFLVHRIGDELYYEIPTSALGKDMLWVTQIAQTTAGSSFAGAPAGDRVVRWEQRGDTVLFRDVHYAIRATTDDPISRAVAASNLAPIIRAFPVKAYGKDQRPVIDVTDLFRSDVPELSARRALGVGAMDSKRSFIESIKSFPQNIEVDVLATYGPSSDGGEQGRPRRPRRPGGRGRSPRDSSGITAMIHHSMVMLPERLMKPRRHDDRVGFFSVRFTDYADDSRHEAEEVRYISRWRLEKKDPAAEVSEPLKPIVFYVGRGVPEKWKPFVKAGIEAWQPAFEAAGFRNAIIGKLAPDATEDPDWDAEDARISTIRWLPSNIENAFGPHVQDPRTGEILEADVRMYHNVQKLVRDWYFVQASACDERARKLPMPDALIGRLIQFVVSHEVGHSLGFPHNMKASSSYSIDRLRDPKWTAENGTAPSIMDYARFNYVAQPGDGAALMPKIGPYDFFAVRWGYAQFPEGADEHAELEKIAHRQIDEPMFRFGGGGDPTAQTEDLSDDAVQATGLGLQNLHRIASFLVKATCEEGQDYRLLENMYDQLWGQWQREMGHVANVVGGVEQINLYYGDAAKRYFVLDADRQRAAVAFLLEHALTTPRDMIPADILGRLTGEGVAERVLSAQRSLLQRLVNQRRINRMSEHAEAADEDDPYRPSELLRDLGQGIFAELQQPRIRIDVYRRNLQRSYVEHLAAALNDPAVDSDLPAMARAALRAIADSLRENRQHPGDDVIGAHLDDLAARIDQALHPLKASAPKAASP